MKYKFDPASFEFDRSSHIYRIDGQVVPSVTQILNHEGFIESDYFTEESRLRGTMVHLGIHTHELGLLDDPPDEFQGYLEAWLKFKKESNFSLEWSEYLMYSRTYRFAGTADCVGAFGNKPAILDIKTSDTVKDWWGYQLAGYHILYDEPLQRRFSLRLRANGSYCLDQFTSRQDRAVFIAALTCYQAKEGK